MKPKKSLGQNFLKDRAILEKIIKAACLNADDLVIEIGPGPGVLTEELVKRAGKIIAIEIDNNLAEKLKIKYKNNKKVEILNGDILKINLPELIQRQLPHLSFGHPLPKGEEERGNYKVVANIPYYITSPIIQLFLETKYPPKKMILMVQKEVAERICAGPGNMSILAVSVQYCAKPELLFYVPKNAFWPIPDVDSALIRITHQTKRPAKDEIKQFFRVVKAGFCAKRKVLSNNLSSSFHISKQEAEKRIKKAGIDPGSRAQELSVSDWKKLSAFFT
jgi:16S rRNA (adenine1518-N6/adenine1519-N6)-dimethyltransferase